MEKYLHGSPLVFSIVISLGLISFVSCIAAEFKRTKTEDLKVDGKLCYLPGSHAFGFGIAAFVCLVIAQIIGNLIVCRKFCSGEKRSSLKARKPTISSTLLMISWMSFGIAVILLSAATSMSSGQPYRKGWLDGECYVVKGGVYIGSAVLVIVTIGSMLGSAIVTMRKTQTEQEGPKVHAQLG